jgi:hypothetical protein
VSGIMELADDAIKSLASYFTELRRLDSGKDSSGLLQMLSE